MKDKILVTGADGFIGSHLVEDLVRNGRKVKAFVYYNSFNSWGWLDTLPQEVMKEVEVFSGDIRDPFGVREAMTGCSSVMHLAALIAIPYSYHSPATYVDTNVNGTLNVMEAARRLAVERVLHTSTSEVYGSAQYVPIDEKHPFVGQSPYSASKIGADQIAYSYYSSFNLPVTIVRPFNTYGPRQSNRAVIPTIITQVASGAKEVKLGALTPTRDFNYVADTVKGFTTIEKLTNCSGEHINVGSGFEISIQDTVQMIIDVMGAKVSIVGEEERMRPEKSEVQRLHACNKKIKSLSSWEPQFSGVNGMRKGIEKTVEWFTNTDNLKKYKTNIYNI